MTPEVDPQTANVVASSDHPACARYALVDADGVVQNVIFWDGSLDTWQPPAGLTPHLLDDSATLHPAGIGWTFTNGKWVEGSLDIEPTPQAVTIDDPEAFQAALAQAVTATTTAGKLNAVIALLSNLG